MPLDSGRKRAAEWNEVEEIENEKFKVACKNCKQIISKKNRTSTFSFEKVSR